jgi:hypothetical protein
MPSRQACPYRWATGSRCPVISGLLRGLTSKRPDVKQSIAIVRPVTGRGEGLAGWPLPRMDIMTDLAPDKTPNNLEDTYDR